MNYKEVIDKVSLELGILPSTVVRYYKYYYLFMNLTISQLPLKQDWTEELFNNMKTSFNIPELGKLGCPFLRYKNMRKLHGTIQEKIARRESATTHLNRET